MKLAAGPIVVVLVAYALSTTSAAAHSRTLYQRLGGYNAIVAVVDDFVGNVAADKRINRFFARANIGRLKARLVEQICQGTGGPCVYTGRTMKRAHEGQNIDRAAFNALVEDLQTAMDRNGVPFRAQNKLLAKLAPMYRDIQDRE